MTVAEVFAKADLVPSRPVPWKKEIDELDKGVYVVALVSTCDENGIVEIDLQNDFEQSRWFTNEPVLYIGQTTKQSLSKRISQFYQHQYGAKGPHRGGQAVNLVETAFRPKQLWVYWAVTNSPKHSEHLMLSGFKEHAGRLPYANRKGTNAPKAL
jgi:hypothetical protein